MAKYLITGITGFAGAHLANLLYDEGHEVYGLIRRTNGMESDIRDVVSDAAYEAITFVYADLTNYRSLRNLFEKTQFDGVFHLAAQSHPPTSFIDPIGTMQTNVIGSANLIQVIQDHQEDCKLMFCSTSEVYGNVGQDGRKIHWEDSIVPSNPYGASKAATDVYLQERMNNGFIKGFITRAFSHTGPRRGRIFSISSDAYQIARMMKGLQEPVLKIGNLSTTRVVMDVRDTVRAYYLAMINPEVTNHVFNICGDTPRKMQYFTDKLIELSGLDNVEQRIHKPFWRPHEIYYQHGDSTNLVEMTGFKEEYDIETTLKDLLMYWYNKI
jgi:GDPmannose 4,6-dehydratase|tara:strand:- start:68 stop:1045 length:978 start_codon:yes stop_codon:yes gene_type:complete